MVEAGGDTRLGRGHDWALLKAENEADIDRPLIKVGGRNGGSKRLSGKYSKYFKALW
jgi:hypothetical protein